MDTMNHKTLEFLFPVPSLPPSRLTPAHSPGVSPQSTEALLEVLKDNHVKWHIFFNEDRFHNHAPHRSLAAWALGADANAIRSGYKKDCEYEKPAFKSPGSITWENFNNHLEKGIPATLEEFIFSRKANLGSPDVAPEKQPQMLNRFLAGLLHPLIHTGHGAEFGLPGMLVEGLAEAAVHKSNPGLLDSLHLFNDESLADKMFNINIGDVAGSALGRTADVVSATVNTVLPQPLVGTASGLDANQRESVPNLSRDRDPHALTILARVLYDRRFKPKSSRDGVKSPTFDEVIKAHGHQIAAYVREWDVDVKNMEEKALWEKKVEELVWSIVVLYGVAGWVDGKDKEDGFTSDFTLMHHVTSSIFIPSFCGLLSAQSCVRLLKGYFLAICVWAIARGQPYLDVKAFMKATKNPASAPTTSLGTTESLTSGYAWDRIFEEARAHHDEHITKTIRSLAAWGSAFGTKRARVPLSTRLTQESASPKAQGLAIDSASANARAKASKGGRKEGETVAEDPDLSPRAWREWKNGTLPASPPSPTSMRSRGPMPVVQDTNGSPRTQTHRRKPSEDADLSPRAWRDAVNHGVMDVQGHLNEDFPESGSSLGDSGITSSRQSDEYLPKTELRGSEYLDGSLFLRVAILTMQRAGWDLEKGHIAKGQKVYERSDEEFWDFKGFAEQHDDGIEKAKA
ncbi:hypothetical protein CPB83DRAFT_896836 [Crepidotus variabilis]|uniref:Uncharacterized protein n=1 Tax=Crepidotus variabilis TaxID=179855 RepID=A0A9P6JMA5_9AGAR|nr:hypothetical protein CPB83DRAFT_896836 [Crepidotus variabilis]